MNEKARKLLEEYASARFRIEILVKELTLYTAILDGARSVASRGENKESTLELIDKAERIVAELSLEICGEEHSSFLAITAISSIDDPEVKLVLEYHYLAENTLQEIADKLHYCLTTIKQLHRRGLETVGQYLQEHGYE